MAVNVHLCVDLVVLVMGHVTKATPRAPMDVKMDINLQIKPVILVSKLMSFKAFYLLSLSRDSQFLFIIVPSLIKKSIGVFVVYCITVQSYTCMDGMHLIFLVVFILVTGYVTKLNHVHQ